jgi:hypothetical protein
MDTKCETKGTRSDGIKKPQKLYNIFNADLSPIIKNLYPASPEPKSSTPINILKNSLNTLMQKVEYLKKEKEKHTLCIKQDLETITENMQLEKIKLENKIQYLRQQNQELKKNSIKIPESPELLLEQINLYRTKVAELEIKHQKNLEKIKSLQNTLGSLKNNSKNSTPPLFSNQSKEPTATLINLSKIKKCLNSKLKFNKLQYKKKLKEIQAVDQKLTEDKINFKIKILRAAQKEKLLELSINESVTDKSMTQKYKNASFLYKPSIKALYC